MRKAMKVAPFAAAALVAIVYFGIRLFGGVSITNEIQTKEGLQQRAAAFEKATRYDDWMGTRVRNGGWAKGILFWPLKPTDAEIEGAGEFAELVLQGQQYAKGCGSVTFSGNTVSEGQIRMINQVADYLQRDDVTWEDPALKTVLTALKNAEAC